MYRVERGSHIEYRVETREYHTLQGNGLQQQISASSSDSSEGGCEGRSNDNEGPPEGEAARNAGSTA